MKSAFLFSITFLLASSTIAQDPASLRPNANDPVGENMEVPPGWEVRLDRPDDSIVIGKDKETADIYFVTMTPGWHIKARPAGIYYHPANTATGNYSVESTIHLFDPQGRNEGYGIIIGGANLDGPDQSYLYFLLRNDGKYLVKTRSGSETETIVGWTASESIAVYKSGGSTAANTIKIDVSDGMLFFFVNDTLVHELENADHSTSGIVGLRINHGLEVHVSDLKVSSD